MARPLRLEIPGGLYHVTSRGDRRENIYLSDTDRQSQKEIAHVFGIHYATVSKIMKPAVKLLEVKKDERM